MADVKICDRCGKTIETSKVRAFGFGAWKYFLFNRDPSQVTYNNWDLCPCCGEKLLRFLNGVELMYDVHAELDEDRSW